MTSQFSCVGRSVNTHETIKKKIFHYRSTPYTETLEHCCLCLCWTYSVRLFTIYNNVTDFLGTRNTWDCVLLWELNVVILDAKRMNWFTLQFHLLADHVIKPKYTGGSWRVTATAQPCAASYMNPFILFLDNIHKWQPVACNPLFPTGMLQAITECPSVTSIPQQWRMWAATALW